VSASFSPGVSCVNDVLEVGGGVGVGLRSRERALERKGGGGGQMHKLYRIKRAKDAAHI
jgi:hypothetical protein